MKKSIALGLGLLAAFGVTMTLRADTTIYNDPTAIGGAALPPLNGEIGNEVTVTGANWQVTGLSIEIYSQGAAFPNGTPGYADFQVQLYDNNGSGGAPGALLWQSAVDYVSYPGGLSTLNFSVPDVAVPDTFTWTLAYSNTSPTPPALPLASDPTVGADDTSWFRGSGGAWGSSGEENFVAQITAVPEPGAGALLSAGALAVWLRGAFKKRSGHLW